MNKRGGSHSPDVIPKLNSHNTIIRGSNKSPAQNGLQQRPAWNSDSASRINSNEIDATACQEPCPHLQIRSRFQSLYQNIKKVSSRGAGSEWGTSHPRILVSQAHQVNDGSNTKLLSVQLNPRCFCASPLPIRAREKHELQVNTLPLEKPMNQLQFKLLPNTRYKLRLASLHCRKMSNNLRDYLSVSKAGKTARQSTAIKRNKSHLQPVPCDPEAAGRLETQLLSVRWKDPSQEVRSMKLSSMRSETAFRRQGFEPPFDTYYYRDLLWRVAYSNEHSLETPLDYPGKIRIFVGKGNNCRLVRSIVERRSWYQLTDKINDAHVVWTQTKVPSIFEWQLKNARISSCARPPKSQQQPVYLPRSIWTAEEEAKFQRYLQVYPHAEENIETDLRHRNKRLKPGLQTLLLPRSPKPDFETSSVQLNKAGGTSMSRPAIKIHNHFINSFLIGNKKALVQTMSRYYSGRGEDVLRYLPITFHVSRGIQDNQYFSFLNTYYSLARKRSTLDLSNSNFNAWIVKPGENTSRGNGIIVCLDLDRIKDILRRKERHPDGSVKTYIIQKYIERPLLYHRRKFDIRHFVMATCSNGILKGYWFEKGYLRTTSSPFTLQQVSSRVHLTNDAVQKHSPDYGRHEKANKVSYQQFHEYLQKMGVDFWKQIYPKMKAVATDVMKASMQGLDPLRRGNNFEIYGLDFMLDEDLNVWLIEVNTNPCLQVCCPLLAGIIPKLVENAFEIACDPVYPPPVNLFPKSPVFKQNCVAQMGFELVYDSRYEAAGPLHTQLLNDVKLQKEEEILEDDLEEIGNDDGQELFEDDGHEIGDD